MTYRFILSTVLLLGSSALADTIAVIGTGDVGGALGTEFAAQGHTIVYGSRDPSSEKTRELVARTSGDASSATPQEAAAQGDIVVLAVPGKLAVEITRGLGDLSGKIVIDPTNRLNRSDGVMSHPDATSNTEIIQGLAPDAFVVKAFNLLSWRTMIDPELAGGPVSIPLAGNSEQAKSKVAELVEGMGLEPIDVGPVENAHWLEGMLILYMSNYSDSDRPSFDFYFQKD